MGNVCLHPSCFPKHGVVRSKVPPQPAKGQVSSRHQPKKGPSRPAKCSNRSIETTPPVPVMMPESDNSPKPVLESDYPQKNTSESEARSGNIAEAGVKLPVQEDQHPPKPSRKPPPVKRVLSAGLQVGSVLKHRTENLKDIYRLGRKLGQGQFGTTYLCVEKATGKEYACKSIMKRKLETDEDVEDVRREIQILYHMSGQPNIISIQGAYEDAMAVHVVMELCSGGELFDRIIQKGHYTEKKAAELARVIVGAIEVCHSLGVTHRDLKPENFLFVDKDEEAPLKAIDFGLSMFFRPGEIFTDVVGSPYYVAPEVLKKSFGPEADVWSAGVILYILLCGVPPFWAETEQGIFDQVLHGNLNFEGDPWPSISDSAKDLVKRMLVKEPRKRPTAHEVLCHPWLQVNGMVPDKPLDPAVMTRLKQFSAMNKLKKMTYRIIAETLSEEEIAGLKEMFKMIDTDNSGQITFEELKAGLRRAGCSINDSELYALMQSADVDNSGTIDYREFVAATLHLNRVDREDHIFAAFSYFDKDGSGYITRDELRRACNEFGMEDIRVEDIMEEVDQDNDGRIDYNEFVSMMKKGDAGFGRKNH